MNVIDSFRNSYEIQSEIGKGSQGATYLLKGGKYIVKLFSNVTNPTELKAKVNFLKQLDLDKDGFAIPLEESNSAQDRLYFRVRIGHGTSYNAKMV